MQNRLTDVLPANMNLWHHLLGGHVTTSDKSDFRDAHNGGHGEQTEAKMQDKDDGHSLCNRKESHKFPGKINSVPPHDDGFKRSSKIGEQHDYSPHGDGVRGRL